MGAGDPQRQAEPPWPVGELAVRAARPAPAHDRQPLQGLQRADQHRVRHVRGIGHHVELVIHAVDEVHVGGAAGPVHGLGASRAPPIPRVRRAVLGPAIRLGLHDDAGHAGAAARRHHQDLPQQVARDGEDVGAGVEGERKSARRQRYSSTSATTRAGADSVFHLAGSAITFTREGIWSRLMRFSIWKTTRGSIVRCTRMPLPRISSARP